MERFPVNTWNYGYRYKTVYLQCLSCLLVNMVIMVVSIRLLGQCLKKTLTRVCMGIRGYVYTGIHELTWVNHVYPQYVVEFVFCSEFEQYSMYYVLCLPCLLYTQE